VLIEINVIAVGCSIIQFESEGWNTKEGNSVLIFQTGYNLKRNFDVPTTKYYWNIAVYFANALPQLPMLRIR